MFAEFYEDNGPLDDARIILEKATKGSFKQVDRLASVLFEQDELELQHKNYDQGCGCCARQQHCLPAQYFSGSESLQDCVYKPLKVWFMLANLEESLSTFQSTSACVTASCACGSPPPDHH